MQISYLQVCQPLSAISELNAQRIQHELPPFIILENEINIRNQIL